VDEMMRLKATKEKIFCERGALSWKQANNTRISGAVKK
jgi:hypothetical protein